MTNLTIPNCEKCGGPLEIRQQGSAQGLFCTKCDWSVVTTNIPEILSDPTTYFVNILSGDYRNSEHLKLVADIAGTNLLTARKLLQGPRGFKAFTGAASGTAVVRDRLQSAGLAFEIKPPFPW